ncbi:hypothetical protein KSD_06220 [Ktedonobacter sp. SOSP1-85]|uniref:tyrosine-type recombinase/integrase n=1 Tax=Ktedonobacter sp. SOSP1-85 TaxID=2778367 RepID=UPI0019153E53|nr:tyrosine-type recombinase/integrase [Ktedonobacter sp. SOSP1-85]GHO72851.1 hypothetical protein KSD_06220 [Ktedonobacter sp. SOSP1-85]
MTTPEKKAISLQRPQVRVFTEDQIQLLQLAAEGKGIGVLFRFALSTGLRKGELLSLHWQDLDMGTRVLSIHRSLSLFPKSNFVEKEIQALRQRSIKLPSLLLQDMELHQQEQQEARQLAGEKWEGKDLIFSDERGNYLSPFSLDRHFQKALEDVNIPPTSFHTVRNTTISLLPVLGVEPEVAQAMLGVKWLPTVTISPSILNGSEKAVRKILDFLDKGGY